MGRKKSTWTPVPASEKKRHKGWHGISRVERDTVTGQYRFRTHVTWTDADGQTHQTETRVCDSPEECRREAKRLLKAKTKAAEKTPPKTSLTIREVFQDHFLVELREKSQRVTTDATTGDVNRYRNARALIEHYTPPEIASTRISEITPGLFGEWITSINQTELSGNSVRRYKTIIGVFIRWLADHGYFKDDDMDIMIKQRLGAVSIKSRADGARTDRVPPSVDDLLAIIDYYRQRGLDCFRNLSRMVLWVVLFCSGVRVEELSALRVSSYDPATATLTVDDAISDREDDRCVRQRIRDGVKRMKNHASIRQITVMRFYRDMLDAYLERYELEFGDKDGFLFPRLAPGGNMRAWITEKTLLRELNRLKDDLGLDPGIDVQMFRHGTATFLIRDMSMSYDDVHAYFGHTSSEMLRSVYATLNLSEKQNRANAAMAGLLAVPEESVIDPVTARRRDAMMLAGDYMAWMEDLISEIRGD